MEALIKMSENQYMISLFSLIIGALLANTISSIRNKTGKFGYTIETNRIGLAADDAVFGTVRITWQDRDVRNLYLCTIELENLSSRDYEDIQFRVYSANDTLLLNERTEVVGSPYIVSWEDSFKERMRTEEGEKATKSQSEEYTHNRYYTLPVLNRGQRVIFSFLCTKPGDDIEPNVSISTPSKGVKLKRLPAPHITIRPIWGVPIFRAIIRALILAVFVVFLCGIFIDNIWAASILSMAFGLTGQIFGAALYRLEKLFRNMVRYHFCYCYS